jgi:hypothetical protein
MWRVAACALLVLCVGCSSSQQAHRPAVLQNADFILQSPGKFFAKPGEQPSPNDNP